MKQIKLSICVPTFNRDKYLNKLLKSFELIERDYLKYIQICISNNFSDDNTKNVVNKYSKKFNIKYRNQKKNIGAAANLKYVYLLADGQWVFVIGDDDLITNEINNFFLFINQKTISNDWIFLPTYLKNKKIFINNYNGGIIKNSEVFKDCLRNTIYKYGYIGSHVIKKKLIKKIINQKSFNIRWPHLSLFLNYLFINGNFYMYNGKIVKFNSDQNLFWNASSNAQIHLSKLDLFNNLQFIDKYKKEKNKIYLLYLRELFSFENILKIILWKTLENNDFKINIKIINRFYFKKFYLINLTHKLLILIISLIPKIIFKKIINLKNSEKINNYFREKELSKKNKSEGFDRLI